MKQSIHYGIAFLPIYVDYIVFSGRKPPTLLPWVGMPPTRSGCSGPLPTRPMVLGSFGIQLGSHCKAVMPDTDSSFRCLLLLGDELSFSCIDAHLNIQIGMKFGRMDI